MQWQESHNLYNNGHQIWRDTDNVAGVNKLKYLVSKQINIGNKISPYEMSTQNIFDKWKCAFRKKIKKINLSNKEE